MKETKRIRVFECGRERKTVRLGQHGIGFFFRLPSHARPVCRVLVPANVSSEQPLHTLCSMIGGFFPDSLKEKKRNQFECRFIAVRNALHSLTQQLKTN